MTVRNTLLVTTAALAAIGFKNEAGWKKTADGALETDGDGNPILIGDDGKETTVGAGYVSRINSEAAQHRREAKEAKDKLAKFGDLSPEDAQKAVDKMKDVNLDDLVNKGEIDNVRKQLNDQHEAEKTTLTGKLSDAEKRIERLALDNAFNSSDLLKNRLAVPEDAARATFRDRFKYDAEKGKVVPLTEAGEALINKHGDIASVDEALETFITARTDKDTWLKAPDASGSGSQGGGGGRGTGNVIKRADYDKMDQAGQVAIGQRAARGEVTIVD